MPLKWSDPAPPKKGVSFYDHVIADTPLGPILLEWKSWKDHDPPCGQMPWGAHRCDSFVIGDTLEKAKDRAQLAWDGMVNEMAKYTQSRETKR